MSVLPPLKPAPPTRLYFPVSAEPGPGGYESVPAGTSLAAFCFDVDAERPRYLARKRAVVELPGRGPQRVAGPLAEAAVGGAEAWLRARVGELPELGHERARLQRLDLDALLLELQEDLALMHLAPGHAPERTRALYLHVCFPGGWNPAALLGKSFPALHARVPQEPGFGRAERAQHAAALFQAPLARYVWSVTAEPTLDRHPSTPRTVDWRSARSLFFRVERQIMVPLCARGDGRDADGVVSLFFIRTYVYERDRLSHVQRATLIHAIEGMSEPMRRYKGIFGHEADIVRLLSPDGP